MKRTAFSLPLHPRTAKQLFHKPKVEDSDPPAWSELQAEQEETQTSWADGKKQSCNKGQLVQRSSRCYYSLDDYETKKKNLHV